MSQYIDGKLVIRPHADEHTDGTDDVQTATAGQKGLMSAAQAASVDSGIDYSKLMAFGG